MDGSRTAGGGLGPLETYSSSFVHPRSAIIPLNIEKARKDISRWNFLKAKSNFIWLNRYKFIQQNNYHHMLFV